MIDDIGYVDVEQKAACRVAADDYF